MELDTTLSFTPVDHPDQRVRRFGFELADPYVEQVWSTVLGPSGTLLLRRLPVLWTDSIPLRVEGRDLAGQLGLGRGVAHQSRFARTLDRIMHFGLAASSPDGPGLDVYLQVAPLTEGRVAHLPAWTRQAHERLLDAHLAQIGAAGVTAPPVTNVSSLTARLDRLQNGAHRATQAQAIGR